MRFNIPNILTLLRIALIPVFVVFFYLPVEGANIITTAIFALAAVTDWFDGYLARKWKETSAFGAFLDPVADKLMVAAALVLIVDNNPTAYAGFWLAIPAVVIIGREITISALREWMAEIGSSATVSVSMMGKIKTTAQMAALVLLLFQAPIGPFPTATVGLLLLYLAAVLTLWSMLLYLRAAWPVLSKS
ncbi:MAG: CDP-diacylglycerol--glycerol-3-phosphate 3-phosphatidyltransferase [Gammaproteobacteria bacterium]|nr:CDP-diacylglycerol--glycerol-3-phosphate 3-phosphatidyltransferase [Gammaproteobacteria bacterium]MCW8959354.1 CDP-diacylglycerol--glycerol-3-phosphate 3-phosphatidyltransferase [Gammaproteobacteria bacterium]MCW9089686.1 CDP-diacylglycerol--glycerol-3-phosphate 3-phosphatidyltransferase [Gammaproteobacteria bacterium]